MTDTRTDIYQTPLIGRYASYEMKHLFSDDVKFSTWRKLWIALAEAEQKLGLNIKDEQIEELKAHVDDINYEVARKREEEVRHDVMAHVYAYGIQCPNAAGIIHLGATSMFVCDNTDILNIREGLSIIKKRIMGVICILAKCVSLISIKFTHFLYNRKVLRISYYIKPSANCVHKFFAKIWR